jgi:hypothetical protein
MPGFTAFPSSSSNNDNNHVRCQCPYAHSHADLSLFSLLLLSQLVVILVLVVIGTIAFLLIFAAFTNRRRRLPKPGPTSPPDLLPAYERQPKDELIHDIRISRNPLEDTICRLEEQIARMENDWRLSRSRSATEEVISEAPPSYREF